jgi:hypothetical protein
MTIPAVYCLLFTVCCLLFAVWCLLLSADYFLLSLRRRHVCVADVKVG